MGFLRRVFGTRQESQPPPDRVIIVGGTEPLEVVGESFYQDALRKVVDARGGRVRLPVQAVLFAEDDNAYDPNAVSVWVAGAKVGHLSREDAAVLRPGLLALQRSEQARVSLPGVLVGGGPGTPSYGVFLNYDPTRFGLSRSSPSYPDAAVSQVRTGFTDAILKDPDDDSYDLDWQDALPEDRLQAMTFLRSKLSTETAPLSRHYLYTELEIVLHGARDEMATALAEYDAACESHQAEMESIRPALIASFGGLPLVDMYRQATIRHQKDRQIGAALAWCRRGIAFYGGQALRPEFESDLVRRAEKLQASLTTLPPKPPRAASTPRGPKATTETLVCATCGRRFERSITRGRKPHQCPECRSNLGAGL